jgi:chromosomal replication initiation ATPase DnaA
MKYTQNPLPFLPQISDDTTEFMLDDCNIEAFQMLDAWPNWQHFCLIISGEGGCGKSHLGKIWARMSEARIISAEQISDYWSEIQDNQLSENLLIDELEGDFSQEDLFHIYNYQKQTGNYLLILSKQSPQHMEIALADLRSRLNSSLHIELKPMGDDFKKLLLHKFFADNDIVINDDVIEYIFNNYSRNMSDLLGLAKRLITQNSGKITLSQVREMVIKGLGIRG